jgi:four helix bundle protein
MSSNNGLKSLRVWNDSVAFSKSIFIEISSIPNFVVRDQLIRCLLSIPSNIAEGYGRHSKKEFSRFLKISLGSCYELITQLEIIRDSDLSENIDTDAVLEKAIFIASSLTALIRFKDSN